MDKLKSFRINVASVVEWLALMLVISKQSRRVLKEGKWYQRSAEWIYRGQGDVLWHLESTLQRVLKEDRWQNELPGSIKNVESEMIGEFRRSAQEKGLPLFPDDVDCLACMQHYGMPTRLLDFSGNPLIALYHALSGAMKKRGRYPRFSLYALREDYLLGTQFIANERFVERTGFRSSEIEHDRQIANWTLGTNRDGNRKPEMADEKKILCVYPRFANKRSDAQQGLFLMPVKLGGEFEADIRQSLGLGDEDRARCVTCSRLREMIETEPAVIDDIVSLRFDFKGGLRSDVVELLSLANINHKTMFPDSEGLAKYMKDEVWQVDDFEPREKRIVKPKINLPLENLPER